MGGLTRINVFFVFFLFFKVVRQVPFQKADDIDNILIKYDHSATGKVEFFKL